MLLSRIGVDDMLIGLELGGSKGLSLIELLIATSIGIIGAMGSYALIANIQGTLAGNAEVALAQQEARVIVERIARELRESSPDTVWPSPMVNSDYIVFYTPRDAGRKFMVDAYGKPSWQRGIAYVLESGRLLRYQLYMGNSSEPIGIETVSNNVERLLFSRVSDMVTISIRTFSEHEGKLGHVARSYADLQTVVKMRN